MCGIFGAICSGAVASTLKALRLLEYRGYDSAGIAVNRGSVIEICKTEGRIAALERLAEGVEEADVAIGHTRWATHGAVCAQNAHPFLSPSGRFAVVHNGIIENYLELKQYLGSEPPFTSQTDSETVAYLLDRVYRGSVLDAVLRVAKMLKGSFAIAITAVGERRLYAVKSKSPLIVGRSLSGAYLCSDIRCVSRWAAEVAVAPDGSVVELSAEEARLLDFDGKPLELRFFAPDAAEEAQTSEGDLMLKEIFEIPQRLSLAKEGYLQAGGLRPDTRLVAGLRRIYLIGCGTAYNSGMQAAAVARKWLDADLVPVIASEFLYDSYPVGGDTLAIFISQSGETADTLRAAEKVRALGGHTYAVTNTQASSLTFICEQTAGINAGSEYAVASTKAYNCQLVVLTLMLGELALLRGTLSGSEYSKLLRRLDEVPDAVRRILEGAPALCELAEELSRCSAVFYIGRTADHPTACEGSLKLKEISYIHSEAYPAGELKHGTLALMEPSVAVVAICTDPALQGKMASSVTEIASRGARVISVSGGALQGVQSVLLPRLHPSVAGIASVVPLQLLAYYTAKKLGRDVDKPRNLAKSVTVE